MKVSFSKKYEKQVDAIKDKKLKQEVSNAVKKVIKAKSKAEMPSLKKMTGYKIEYRIRIGDYRIGVRIEGNSVTFVGFDHRKDFYKRFP